MRNRSWIVLVALLALQACASFESGELPLLDRWPPPQVAAAQRQPLRLDLEGLPDKFAAGWLEQTKRVFEESERFQVVATDAAGLPAAGSAAPRRIRLVVEHSRPEIVVTRTFMYLCAMTAGILPAGAAHTFEVRAIVLDENSNPVGMTSRTVTSATWVGWVFLPALPFAGVGMSGMVRDTMRSILLECTDEGWL